MDIRGMKDLRDDESLSPGGFGKFNVSSGIDRWWGRVLFARAHIGILVLIMGVGILVGVGFGLRLLGSEDGVGVAGFDVLESGSDRNRDIWDEGNYDPRFGLSLSSLEASRVGRFGIPLMVGPRGVPLIEDHGSGEVREVTEFELNFPLGVEYVRLSGNSNVVVAPGHTGYGVRWWLPRMADGLPDVIVSDRLGWFLLHEDMLQSAVDDLFLAVHMLESVEFDSWDARWGRGVVDASDAMNEVYAFGDVQKWELIPAVYSCDDVLEVAYHDSFTAGCPSDEYVRLVVEMWKTIGWGVEALGFIGKAVLSREDVRTRHMILDSEFADFVERKLLVVENVLVRLPGIVEELDEKGVSEGNRVRIDIP